jgi:hypothetical protein
MSDLVRVRIGDIEKNVGAEFAEIYELEVLDEPIKNDDGTLRGETRKDGRPMKSRTSVAKSAADKADKPADNG